MCSFGTLGDIEGFVQLIPGFYISDKTINITRIDKVYLKCDYSSGSILYGVGDPIKYSFALDKPPVHELYMEPRIKLFKKLKKSLLSHIRFLFGRQRP